jgi:apoptosis inducing membrane protein (fragment)
VNNLDNNLRNVEKMLRCFAKKCKDLKYTRGLLFSFLMSGTVAQAVEKKIVMILLKAQKSSL